MASEFKLKDIETPGLKELPETIALTIERLFESGLTPQQISYALNISVDSILPLCRSPTPRAAPMTATQVERKMMIGTPFYEIQRFLELSRSSFMTAVTEILTDEVKFQNYFGQFSQIPDDFKCPITCELMTTPVFAPDGITYDYSAISDWLRHKNISPVTGEELYVDIASPTKQLHLNKLISGKIIGYCESRLDDLSILLKCSLDSHKLLVNEMYTVAIDLMKRLTVSKYRTTYMQFFLSFDGHKEHFYDFLNQYGKREETLDPVEALHEVLEKRSLQIYIHEYLAIGYQELGNDAFALFNYEFLATYNALPDYCLDPLANLLISHWDWNYLQKKFPDKVIITVLNKAIEQKLPHIIEKCTLDLAEKTKDWPTKMKFLENQLRLNHEHPAIRENFVKHADDLIASDLELWFPLLKKILLEEKQIATLGKYYSKLEPYTLLTEMATPEDVQGLISCLESQGITELTPELTMALGEVYYRIGNREDGLKYLRTPVIEDTGNLKLIEKFRDFTNREKLLGEWSKFTVNKMIDVTFRDKSSDEEKRVLSASMLQVIDLYEQKITNLEDLVKSQVFELKSTVERNSINVLKVMEDQALLTHLAQQSDIIETSAKVPINKLRLSWECLAGLGVELSQGHARALRKDTAGWSAQLSGQKFEYGTYYFEFIIDRTDSDKFMIGLASDSFTEFKEQAVTANCITLQADGELFFRGEPKGTVFRFETGDYLGMLVDIDQRTLVFYLNGERQRQPPFIGIFSKCRVIASFGDGEQSVTINNQRILPLDLTELTPATSVSEPLSWDTDKSSSDLLFSRQNQTVTKTSGEGWSSAISSLSISSGLLYFEFVTNVMTARELILGLVGQKFASGKADSEDCYTLSAEGSLVFNGKFLYKLFEFGEVDRVGILVNMVSREAIFVKNGAIVGESVGPLPKQVWIVASLGRQTESVTLNSYPSASLPVKLKAYESQTPLIDKSYVYWDQDIISQGLVLSRGNYTVTNNVDDRYKAVVSRQSYASGLHYFEFAMLYSQGHECLIGLTEADAPRENLVKGSILFSLEGKLFIDRSIAGDYEAISDGDRVGLLVNLHNRSLTIYKNGRKITHVPVGPVPAAVKLIASMKSQGSISLINYPTPPSEFAYLQKATAVQPIRSKTTALSWDSDKLGPEIKLSHRGLRVTRDNSIRWGCQLTAQALFQGVHYAEFFIERQVSDSIFIGLVQASYDLLDSCLNEQGAISYQSSGDIHYNGLKLTSMPSFSEGDYIGVLVNLQHGSVTFFKNGKRGTETNFNFPAREVKFAVCYGDACQFIEINNYPVLSQEVSEVLRNEYISLIQAPRQVLTWSSTRHGPGLALSDQDTTVTKSGSGWSTQLSEQVISEGVHYIEFVIKKLTSPNIYIGVASTELNAFNTKGSVQHCFALTAEGRLFLGGSNVGEVFAFVQDDRVGLLIDMNAQSITFFLNRKRQEDAPFTVLPGSVSVLASLGSAGQSVAIENSCYMPIEAYESLLKN